MKKKGLALLLATLLITGCNTIKKDEEKKSNDESNVIVSNSNYQVISNESTKKEYTNEELVKLASDYYEKLNGKKAQFVEVDHTDGDNVVIHLYEVVDGHTATFDWYTINKKSAKGTDFLENEIDLTKLN